MRTDDLTVEVRDKTLTRLGVIQPEFLDLEGTPRDSAVGEWRLRLTADHPMAPHLRTPGSGIIVTGPTGDPWFSGPMTRAVLEVTYEDQVGVVVVDGVTDEIILWDALAWPDPDFDWSSLNMDFAYDTFTGLPWDLMAYFLNINLPRFGGLLGSLLTIDLSAVDGSGEPELGPNLIPNPDPLPVDLEEDGYSSYIGSGWSDNGSYGNVWRILTDFGPEGYSDSCYRGIFQYSVGDWRIVATDAGTSAPAVGAGTYRVSLHAQTESYDENINVLAGVIWYDSSGDVISTSLSDPVALEANGSPGPRWYTPSDPEHDYSPPSIWAGNTAYVEADFSAPEGAAFGQPFSQWDLPPAADTDYCLMSAAYLGTLT